MSETAPDLHAALRQYFAFPHFRPGQAEALQHLAAGRDALVVMPTGSGKSLIYQLGALLQPAATLVVSPLVALMKDQVDSLTRRHLPATFINSSLTPSEQAQRLRGFERREYKILLVSPERLRSQNFLDTLARVPLSLLAVDEAHCLSQWGHDFRPDYLHIAAIRRQFQPRVTLALTATATPREQQEILRQLEMPHAQKLILGFNRPLLSFEVTPVSGRNAKLAFVRDFLARAEGAGIIYTGSRKDAEEVASFVRQVCQVKTRHYHGQLEPQTRSEVQDAFMAGDLPLVVATNAFGMGIDRPDVRFVLHYTLPGSLEAYYQEAGRAGRDGLPARAVLLYSTADTRLHDYLINEAWPSKDELCSVHEFLEQAIPTSARSPAGRQARFSREEAEAALGLSTPRLRVALEQLEAAQALRRRPNPQGGLLEVDVLALSEAALNDRVRHIAERRDHKRRLLLHMERYAETSTCRRRLMLDYFGDSAPAEAPLCCDNCLARQPQTRRDAPPRPAEPPRPLPSPAKVRVPGATVQRTLELLRSGLNPEQIAAERQLTVGTVYSHLAGLLAEGALELAQVMPRATEQRIRDAIAQVGSVELLVPLKQVLPPEIDFSLIRCVVVAWKREHGLRPPRAPLPPNPDLRELILACVRSLPGKLPRSGIAKLLVGSDSARVAEFRTSPFYNRLGDQPRAEVQVLIDEMLEQGILEKALHGYLVPGRRSWAPPASPRAAPPPAEPGRANRMYQLGQQGSLAAAPELIAALGDPHINVRRLAASALGKLRTIDAVEPLSALLAREPAPQVRQYAIKALGHIGDPRAKPALERILQVPDERPYNHEAARSALRMLRAPSRSSNP